MTMRALTSQAFIAESTEEVEAQENHGAPLQYQTQAPGVYMYSPFPECMHVSGG